MKLTACNLAAMLPLSRSLWSIWATISIAYLAVTAVGAHDSGVNNWAVLVCTSRYWFNYRHMANTLGMYRTVKRLGIPDSNIILMLADDAACNPRNAYTAKVFGSSSRAIDLYGESIEVDYRGYEVSVENFIRLLTGRVSPDMPISKRLNSDERSNIFVYMTGHGGDEFLKFQDAEEISAFDMADAFQQMHVQKRYREIFYMIDTCQANTMYSKLYSPGILATGSSRKGENSYSHHSDAEIGVAVIDRYTHFVLNHLEMINKTSTQTLQDLFNLYDYDRIHSLPGVRTDLYRRDPAEVLLTEFFGGVAGATVEGFRSSSIPPVEDVPVSSTSNLAPTSKRVKRTDSRRDVLEEQAERRRIMQSFGFKWEIGGAAVFTIGVMGFLAQYYRAILDAS